MERETGIEPALVAWKATVLPLNYSRPGILQTVQINQQKTNFGGGRWIRTTEGMSQQIYSLPPLAAWVSLRIRCAVQNSKNQLKGVFAGRWIYSSHPETRPSGRTASRYVQIRSRRICRTTEGMSQQIYSLPSLAAWVSLRNSVWSRAPTSACAGQNDVQRTPGIPAWQSLCTEPHIVRSQPYPCQGAVYDARQALGGGRRPGSGRSRRRYSCPIP